MFRILIASCLSVLICSGAACDNDKGVEAKPTIASATITLRFSGPRFAGSFYSDFLPATDHAVWIEDAEGQYVKTLGISKSVVSVAQYSHVVHLPTWMAKSGTTYEALQAETEEGVAPSFDAVSGASVYFLGDVTDSTLVFEWDLNDKAGERVSEGEFRFCAEVANITKDEATSYQINAEAASGLMDLKAQNTTPPGPTEHILGLTAEYGYAE